MSGDLPVSPAEWAQTDVHKASTYSCGKCGERFENPAAFYRHLDKEHPNG